MPNLPTLTINDSAVWNRLMAAFNNDPVSYKTWLKNALQNELINREISKIQETAQAEMKAKNSELNGYLDGAS